MEKPIHFSMTTAKRFVIWIAVSSKEQAERVSPDLQASLARQHVAKWGGVVVDELSVAESRDIVLLSAAAAAIPAYARLYDHIQRRAFDVLICYDLGRLGRAYPLIMQIVELCARAGIHVYEIENPPHDLERPAGYDEMLIRALKSGGYQHEVMKMRQRMAFGRRGRAQAGEFTHVPPYGYRWAYGPDGARAVEVDPEAAAVVRKVADMYLDGGGIPSIVAYLNESGIPTPAKKARWFKNSVMLILSRAWIYAGYNEYKRGKPDALRVPATWPPLWDAATAQRIEAERAARKANRRIPDTRGRLTGIVICEQCGRAMNQVINEGGDIRDAYDGRIRRAKFYCYPYHKGGNIGTNRVLAALQIALEELAAADLSAIPDDDQAQAQELAARLSECDAALQRQQAALRRADTAFVSGVMDDERYREQVSRLRAAIAAAETERAQLQAAAEQQRQAGSRAERLAQIAASGGAMLTLPDTAAANAWLRRYVRVYVRENQVTEVRFL